MQKRIFYITPVYPGVREFLLEGKDVDHGMPGVYRLLKGLEAHGWEIHVLAEAEDHNKTIKVSDQIFVHPYQSPDRRRIIPGRLLFSDTINGILKGYMLAKNHRPDIIYAVCDYAAIIGYILSRLIGVPNVTRLFGTSLFSYLHNGKIPKRVLMQSRPFSYALQYVIPSKYLIITDDGQQGDKIAKLLKVNQDRLKFWKNGVDRGFYKPEFNAAMFKTSVLGIPANAKVFLSVSRLDVDKRIDRQIEAIVSLLRKRSDVFLVLVGDGEDKDRLKKLTQKLNVDSQVIFMGQVPNIEVPDFLNAADIFLALYDNTNFTNTTLEAMTCARCVVALDVGDTWKVIKNGTTGLMISETELFRLPDLLATLIDDDSKRIELGSNASEFILHNFESWDERIEKEINLINDLVKRRK